MESKQKLIGSKVVMGLESSLRLLVERGVLQERYIDEAPMH